MSHRRFRRQVEASGAISSSSDSTGFGWRDVRDGFSWVAGGLGDFFDVNAEVDIRQRGPTRVRISGDPERGGEFRTSGPSNTTLVILVAIAILLLMRR